MADTPKDEPWLANVVQHLDTTTRDLDAATLSRLNRARQAALSELKPARTRFWRFLPVLATAGALALAIGLWSRAPTPAEAVPSNPAEDFVMLSEGEQIDLYKDLEFYAWLDGQQSSDGSSADSLVDWDLGT